MGGGGGGGGGFRSLLSKGIEDIHWENSGLCSQKAQRMYTEGIQVFVLVFM